MSEKMKILVALDFSENPEVILEKALTVAKKYQASIYTIHVIEEMPRMSFYYDAYKLWEEFRDNAVKETLVKMNKYISTLSDKFCDVESIIEVGDPCEKILETAEKLKIDLIITGHHTRKGFLSQVLYSNISERIVKTSTIPVLTFPIQIED
jgi:nucleotide-binding universal stress UspA family protein